MTITLDKFHTDLQGIVPPQILNGANLLDGKDPGWTERIEMPTLDITDCFTCVLGQDFYDRWMEKGDSINSSDSPFRFGVIELGLLYGTNYLYGFDINMYSEQNGEDYGDWWDISAEELTESWAEYLRLRREAGL